MAIRSPTPRASLRASLGVRNSGVESAPMQLVRWDLDAIIASATAYPVDFCNGRAASERRETRPWRSRPGRRANGGARHGAPSTSSGPVLTR